MPVHREPVLTDAGVTPDAAGIDEILGDAFAAWQRLDAALAEPSLGLDLSWRYYRDGGWLRKATRSGKTVAWLAVWKGYATVTFYVAARHRPVVVEIRTAADVDAALTVLRFKLAAR